MIIKPKYIVRNSDLYDVLTFRRCGSSQSVKFLVSGEYPHSLFSKVWLYNIFLPPKCVYSNYLATILSYRFFFIYLSS